MRMPPNQDEAVFELATPDAELAVNTQIQTPPSSEGSFPLSLDSEDSLNFDRSAVIIYGDILVPPEQNLRDLLLKVTGSDSLATVTSVKLQVIARDISLQHLNVHTPNLKELVLDGSIVYSLRDLGCRLKCLKVLKVNGCKLTSFDGIFGLESLEELHAGNNSIQDISPCSSLPDVKLIDVRNNKLRDLDTVSYLSLCPLLEHLVFDGNEKFTQTERYRQNIRKWLPNLTTLDGTPLLDDDSSDDDSKSDDEGSVHEKSDNDNDSDCAEDFEKDSNEYTDENIPDVVSAATATLTILPPINLSKINRPSTSVSKGDKLQKNPSRSRPATARASGSKSPEVTRLPNILTDSRKQFAPSSLTSGSPICGNIAASLRNRLKCQEAWTEDNSNNK